MKIKKIFIRVVLALQFSLFIFSTSFAASGIEAFALDTIAGTGTVLTAFGAAPGEQVVFTLQQSNGQIQYFEAIANNSWVAKYEPGDYYTRVAGTYYVSAELKKTKLPGAPKPFRVYPDSASSSRSIFETDRAITPINIFSKLRLQLTDSYGNPISGHLVRVVSSRNSDVVQSLSPKGVTNPDGVAEFQIQAMSPGPSTYTAYDMTGEAVLETRIQILFTSTAVNIVSDDAVGGSFVPTVFAQDDNTSLVAVASNVSTFEFEEIPQKVQKNEPMSLTVAAYDKNKNLVSNYLGKIHFTITSNNANLANLPEDYTFTSEDLGKHPFKLGFQFQEEDEYTLRVADGVNDKIYGETKIVVAGAKDATNVTGQSVILSSPLAGKFSQNVQTLSGTGPAGKDVKIFDNNTEIGRITAKLDGAFEYKTQSLADGDHEFYVAAVTEKGAVLGTSEKIKIAIDSKPPEILSLIFDPSDNIAPGDPVQMSLVSESGLTKSAVSVLDVLYELTPDTQKNDTYIVAFPAPQEAGEYSVKVFLADELGNEISYDSQGSFVVVTSNRPSAVTNLEVFPGSSRVNLSWGASQDDNGIDHYRVYYGSATDALIDSVDTSGSAATWYIPNLENGIEYFFKVVAVDIDGNEGDDVPAVSARPDSSYDAMFPAADGDLSDTGPEFLWLLFPSFLGASFLRKKKAGGRK